jgi:hypothetical protein
VTTYATRETSVADGAPIEFYRFVRGSGDTEELWLHVDAPDTQALNSEAYTPTPGLARTRLAQSGEESSMQVTVTLPRDVCLADEFRGSRSPAPIRLTIYRTHRGLDDSEAKQIFVGEASGATFEGSTLTVTCRREESTWGRSVPRIPCQRLCPHVLYDPFCGADPDAVTCTARILTITAALDVLTVEELDAPPGSTHLAAEATYYRAGVVDRFGRKAFIIQQDADALTLQTPLLDAVVGDLVSLTAGCNRQPSDCAGVHDNIGRYGGYPLIPDRNPWKGVA